MAKLRILLNACDVSFYLRLAIFLFLNIRATKSILIFFKFYGDFLRTKLRYTLFKSHIFDLLPLLQLLQSNCVFRLKILVTVIRSKKLKLNLCTYYINTREGIEDTRLEAKAKDTKKSEAKAKNSPSEDRPSRGQGQECSRPRTKDTKASVLPPKKRSSKIFSCDLKKKTVFKNFFQVISEKTVQKKIYWQICRILTFQK